jgi:FkbM family methyltransferase
MLPAVVAAQYLASSSHLGHDGVMHVAQCVLREHPTHETLEMLPLLLRAAGGSPGIFVEVGAHFAGYQTWLLEKCFNWTGVLIDAHPRNFARLMQADRRARKVEAAVCPPGRNVTMPDWREEASKGSSSTLGSGVVSAMEYNTPEYTHTWAPILNATRRFSIPCRGLSEILAEAGIEEVDFLSVDVQGAEEAVLQTANLGTVRGAPTMFKTVLVEAERTAMEKNVRVRHMLENAGLKKLHLPGRREFAASYDEFYVRPSLVAHSDPRPSKVARPLVDRSLLAHFLEGVAAAPDVWTKSPRLLPRNMEA